MTLRLELKLEPIRIDLGIDPATVKLIMGRFDRLEAAISQQEQRMGKIIDDKIAAFATQVNAEFGKVNTSLDNIVEDEKKQSILIQQLKDQIANDSNSNLSPESQALLDNVVVNARAMSDRTQAAADAIPDEIPAPTQ